MNNIQTAFEAIATLFALVALFLATIGTAALLCFGSFANSGANAMTLMIAVAVCFVLAFVTSGLGHLFADK
jgi:ABC-type transport system involved in multi-copper enzyme maturation permease subunit